MQRGHLLAFHPKLSTQQLLRADSKLTVPKLLSNRTGPVSDVEQFEILVLGSGEAGKYLAGAMAQAGDRAAVGGRGGGGGGGPAHPVPPPQKPTLSRPWGA